MDNYKEFFFLGLRASNRGPALHPEEQLRPGLPGDPEGDEECPLPLLHQRLRLGDNPAVLPPLSWPEALSGPPEALHVVLRAGLGQAGRPQPGAAQRADHRKHRGPQQL